MSKLRRRARGRAVPVAMPLGDDPSNVQTLGLRAVCPWCKSNSIPLQIVPIETHPPLVTSLPIMRPLPEKTHRIQAWCDRCKIVAIDRAFDLSKAGVE